MINRIDSDAGISDLMEYYKEERKYALEQELWNQ